MSHDFDRPLGYDPYGPPPPRRGSRRRAPRGPVAVWAVAGLMTLAVGYAALFGSPDGGRARNVGRIAQGPAPDPSREEATGSIPPKAGGTATADEVERASGVRVTRGGAAPGALVIKVEDALGGRLPPAPDPRLAERTKTAGVLPRVGADGVKPVTVYARPFAPDPAKAAAPRIALVVGGLGLSATTTRDAIDLPPAVTLAFAPYGGAVEADAARARDKGHETILQLPMEPLDSARNDPGPHTLQLAAGAAQTDADLRWLLSRFSCYFAVSPYLGGRFLQSPDALAPVLRDLAARGLGLIDDGAAGRTALEEQARSAGLPMARAAVRLDGEGSDAKAIDAALAKLEATARRDGFAIGSANALPAVIERLARFAASVEGRGFVLAPASAALGRGDNSLQASGSGSGRR